MEIVPNYLNKLKDLFNKNFLYDESFIDFRDELKALYPLVKKEISNSFIKLEPSQYARYSEQEINEINKLNFNSEDKVSNSVKLWFIKYGLEFSIIESILNLDNETSLYAYLKYNISNAPDDKMADDLYTLQTDFLKFTKAYFADDITNYIQSFNNSDRFESNIDNNKNSSILSVDILERSNDNSKSKLEIEINPYPRIFKCKNAYTLFSRFNENLNKKHNLANYSFIYRQMQKDKLIYENVGDSEYRNWLSVSFNVNIVKTKQLADCSTATKIDLYSTLKDSYKPY